MAKKNADNFLDYIPKHVEKYRWESDEEGNVKYYTKSLL